jgi:hypothetical protein
MDLSTVKDEGQSYFEKQEAICPVKQRHISKDPRTLLYRNTQTYTTEHGNLFDGLQSPVTFIFCTVSAIEEQEPLWTSSTPTNAHNRALLQNLTIAVIFKKLPAFIEAKAACLCLGHTASGLYATSK